MLRRTFICCYSAFCIAMLWGCSVGNPTEQTINVDVSSCLREEVSIYEIFSDVELIKLDNSHPISNAFHTGESYIACDGNNFYILDERTLAIHKYDSNGQLLCYSDKVGRGHGEFTMACQIHFNTATGLLEILNPMGKIMMYSPESLQYVSQLDFIGSPRSTHNYYQSGEDYILYSAREKDKLWKLQNGTDVSSFGYCPPEYLRKYMSPQYPFLEIDGKPCFFRVYDGLIYRFDMEACTLIPFIAWNLGEYQCELSHIPEDLDVREYYDFILRQSHKRISPFFSMKSIGNMLLANVVFNELTYTLCYNSDTGTTFLFDKTSENMKVLAELTYGTVMYKFIDAHSLPEYVNREILSPASQTIYDNIIAEDSSAIIKYSL